MQSVQLPKAAKQGLFRAIKAGVRGEFSASESGTPQGGIISPLLANIVLHGLENVGQCRFVNIKGDKSPYDGDFVYWAKRENANYDGITARLLKKQNHKCTACNLSFISGDIAELHHIDGNHSNWRSNNLEVLHRECHQHQTIHGWVRVRTAG